MKLVKQDGTHAFQGGIMLENRSEHAFRDDFDARRGAGAALESHAIADGPPDRLAERLRHAAGHGPGRKTTRLEHDEAPAAHPGLAHQFQRHDSALTGAGRRLQNRVAMRVQRLPKCREDL